jgi:hypothetical protein
LNLLWVMPAKGAVIGWSPSSADLVAPSRLPQR